MPHGNIDLSNGSYAANSLNGVRSLVFQGIEAQLTNNERFWNNMLEEQAIEKGFTSGYEMANKYWDATAHAMAEARAAAGTPTPEEDRFAALDEEMAKQDGAVIVIPDEFGEDSELTDEDIEKARTQAPATPYVPPVDDINENASVAVEEQSEENLQTDPDADGLDNTPAGPPVDQDVQPIEPLSATALEDPNYHRVVKGWNQKLDAPSQDLSSLIPFCELYAVFDESDIVVKEEQGSTRYTAIKDRMIQVNFKGPDNTQPALPPGLTKNCSIVKVAGDNKSQLESDSSTRTDFGADQSGQSSHRYDDYKSYKGVPGIGDLAVSRGSAAAQNVKYDLSITMPNPELINERFEYSKLMLMNSAFLIIYGWNIKDGPFDAQYYPPSISKHGINDIVIGNGIGGFWSAAIINLSNFSFSFDTVGHLVGKLTFLNSSGIFLGTLSTEAVGNTMLKLLREPSETVLRRIGGEQNQNFIWANGIPWSATPPDAENAEELNIDASRSEVLSNFFDIQSGDQTSGQWSVALNRSIAGLNIVERQVVQLRRNIVSLMDLGEEFLTHYRIHFINQLFASEKSGGVSYSQVHKDKLAQIVEMTDFKAFSSSTDEDGRKYGPGKKFMEPTGDSESKRKERAQTDEIIDSFFEYQIRGAYNTFFQQRFGTSGAFFIDSTLLDTSIVRKINPGDGNTVGKFRDLRGSGNSEITRIFPPSNRVRLIPKALSEYIQVATPRYGDVEDSYIKNMPTFGVELQRKVIEEFRKPENLNYNNFYSAQSKVDTANVLPLIESTSIVSVPVPVTEEDRMSLEVENRTYSEILGTGSNAEGIESDGSKMSIKDVLMGFVFLNPLPRGPGDSDSSYNQSLFKVEFYSIDVLVSLKNTTFGVWAQGELDAMSETTDNGAVKFNFKTPNIEGFMSKLGHVSAPNLDEDGNPVDGRFPARKYAVLKNGWVVSQVQEGLDTGWKDTAAPASPIIGPDGETRLNFIMDLLPPISNTTVGEGADAISYYENLKKNAPDSAALGRYEIILSLRNRIAVAAEGTQMMERRDLGIAEQDQFATTNDTGNTTHTIMRQPVYHFLGSVLESLRVTTSDRVKFLYSEVVPRKSGEDFYISIPESSGDSVQNTYDLQIANIDRQLLELGGEIPDSDDAEDISLVSGGTTPAEASADELEKLKQDWDEALVAYIKSRGQDTADFWNNVVQNPSGVYKVYTNYRGESKAVIQRSPTWGFPPRSGSDGVADTDVAYINSNAVNLTDGFRNVRAPWIYRLGGDTKTYEPHQTPGYYMGPDAQSGRAGNGFMRLWRPEDLDAALRAYDRDEKFWHRKPTDKDSRKYGIVNDSFGQPAPDYGYQWIFKSGGGIKDNNKSRLGRGYETKHIENAQDRVINKLLSWLNWFPVDENADDPVTGPKYGPTISDKLPRWYELGSDLHQRFGRVSPATLSHWLRPHAYDTEAEKRVAGWYKIKWPRERQWDGSYGNDGEDEDFYVKGIVVEDFIYFSGVRPTKLNPKPSLGASEQGEIDRIDQINDLTRQRRLAMLAKEVGDLKTQFKRLPIRTTYEIPVNIDTIKQFLSSEPNAPLHKLLKKVVASTKETIPAIQLSMRPAPSDPTYIDIFPSAMNYDGVIQEVFTEVDVSSSVDAGDSMGIKAARKSVSKGASAQSKKVIVCQFGTARSLVESFGLSSKIDPSAFSSFRLPAVVGGASMNVVDVLRGTRETNPAAYANMLTDFADILGKGLTRGTAGLKKLKIINVEGGSTVANINNLENFLMSDVPAISKAASTFVEDMMSQDVSLYNTILTLQNDFFTGLKQTEEGTAGEPGTRLAGSKFYGNILSTFLRTANLTIHGTTGLNVFNLVYLKGLLNGIEGLYLISSVNESLAASTFTTTLECKLIEYTNNDPKTNPMAYKGASDLNRLASIIDEGKSRENAEFGVDYTLDDLATFIEKTDKANGIID